MNGVFRISSVPSGSMNIRMLHTKNKRLEGVSAMGKYSIPFAGYLNNLWESFQLLLQCKGDVVT